MLEKVIVLVITSILIDSIWSLINSIYYNHGLTFVIFSNVTIAISLIIYAYLRTKNHVLSFYYAFTAMTITMIGGLTAGTIFAGLFDVRPVEVQSDILLYFSNWLPSVILIFIIGKYLGIYLHHTYVQLPERLQKNFAINGAVISGLTYVMTLSNALLPAIISYYLLLYFLDIVTIALIFFLYMTLMAKYATSQQNYQQEILKNLANQHLKERTEQLEKEYTNMREFRHDHLNLLASFLSYETLEEIQDNIKKHLNYTQTELTFLDHMSTRLSMINIPELKSLLQVKFAKAAAYGIDVAINIAEPVYNVAASKEDLCRMIGIMVDNAIEELLAKDYQDRFIAFTVVDDQGKIIIDCTNPIKSAPLIRKMFDKGYSTKGSNRGNGLAILKKICDNSSNISYKVRLKDNQFTIILIIRG